MRHRVKGKKLNRDMDHRRALRKNLATSIIENDSVITSITKAKYVRPYVEKLVTKARSIEKDKKNVLDYLRAHLTTDEAVRRLVEEVAPKFKDRPGGYTRIVRVGNRSGDNAMKAKISFVE